jgi:LysM repeat protein
VTDEARRTAARIAAPVAFLLAVTVAVVLIRAGLQPAADEPAPLPAPVAVAEPQVVVVRKGDTLESIAAANGTTVVELRRLNPNVDAVQLVAGRQIRVR